MGKAQQRKNSSNNSSSSDGPKNGQKNTAKNKCSSGVLNESTKSVVGEIGSVNCSVSDATHGAHSVVFNGSVMDNSVFALSEGEAGNGAEGRIISQVS
ncbi:hypothetical protein DPMN_047660 [Dreissena polymorpha]|uniref:Uncharacterized protein n=1 Tax=Dreissena polymorpha TaxID=45954 RepID=A0A9D4DBU9_DREPO|nr:hypothetical protein DPMN_047660 [Dreissena polymorpha]